MIRSDYWRCRRCSVPELPGPLRLTPSFPFAGRSRELATLRMLIPRAEGEGLPVRADRAARPDRARAASSASSRTRPRPAGALVLYGACDSVVRRAVRAVRGGARAARARHSTRRRCAPRSALHGGELTRLLPDLAQRVGELPPPVRPIPTPSATVCTARSPTCSRGVGRRAPLVVVIEDGHWADTPTLLLLRHLARGALGRRARCVVTTFRDTEAEVPEALSAALVDLRRSEGVVRLRLGGLSAEEISEFVAARGRAATMVRICRRSPGLLSELTGGNAFLMTELWRTLLESGPCRSYDGATAAGRAAARRAREPGGRARGRQPAARAAERRHHEAARAGGRRRAGVRARERSRSPGLADAELLAALERGDRARHDRGGARAAARLPVHARAGAPRALRPHARRCGGPSCTCGSARRWSRRRRRREAADLAELAYHFGAAAPVDGAARAIEYSCWPARAALEDAGLRRGRAHASRPRSSSASTMRAGGPRRSSSSARPASAPARSDDAIEAFRAAAQIARELGDAEPARARRGRLRGGLLAAGDHRRGRGRAARRGIAGARGRRLRAARELLAGLGRALRVHGRLRGEARSCAAARDRDGAAARRSARARDRARALVLVARRRSLEQTLEMLVRGSRPRRGASATSELQAEAMEWRVAALIALGDLRPRRARARRGPRDGRASAPAVHAARGRALRLDARPVRRKARRGRGFGAALARVEPAAHRAATPRASTASRCSGSAASRAAWPSSRAVTRVLADSDRSRGAWRPGSRRCWPSSEWRGGPARACAGARGGLRRSSAPRSGLASLTYLADACVAGRRRGAGRACCTPSWRRSPEATS